MLEIISALAGFVAPFLPEVVKYFQRRQDNEHELAMLNLQMQRGALEHTYRMEEINAYADLAESVEIHKPTESFGVQLLDAAKGNALSGWALYPAFYLFALLDFVSGLVRPGITYAAFGFYVSVKWAELSIALQGSGLSAALLQVWGAEDRAIVLLVLSYWFGHRSAKAAFGGSAMTTKAGA
jgi:hypothetical protein